MYRDWTDEYIEAARRARQSIFAPITTRRVQTSELTASANRPKLLAIARNKRRRSATVLDNTNQRPNKEQHQMPTVTRKAGSTKPASKAKPTVKATQSADAAVHESDVILSMVKAPSGKGGYKYDDSAVVNPGADKELGLHVTSMYLSQHTIASAFGGKAPKTLVISAGK